MSDAPCGQVHGHMKRSACRTVRSSFRFHPAGTSGLSGDTAASLWDPGTRTKLSSLKLSVTIPLSEVRARNYRTLVALHRCYAA